MVWKKFQSYTDIDLHGQKLTDGKIIQKIFTEIASIDLSLEDGLIYNVNKIIVTEIREQAEYGGLRISIPAKLGNSKIPIQIDIGFGDAITPRKKQIEFPVLLEHPKPLLFSYPIETFISEKFEAMIRLGIINSRMKDFFDIYAIKMAFDIDAVGLLKACQNTFKRRKTDIPPNPPIFTDEITSAKQKSIQWKAFIKKSKPETDCISFEETIIEIKQFLYPIFKAIRTNEIFNKTWSKNTQKWI